MKYVVVNIKEFNRKFEDKGKVKKYCSATLSQALDDAIASLDQMTNNTNNNSNSVVSFSNYMQTFQATMTSYTNAIEEFIESAYNGVSILEVGFRNKIKVIESKNDVSKSGLEKKIDGKRYSERLCKKFGLNPIETFEDLDGAKLFVEINGTK